MKTYLVFSANKTDFLKATKRFKVKFDKLPCYVLSVPVFACKSKKVAIKECRKQNNFEAKTEIEFLISYDTIYYFQEIKIY